MTQMSWDEACKLDPSLISLRSVFSIPTQTQIVSGQTNCNWKLSFANGDSKVWRPVSHSTQAFNISRQQEFQILQNLSIQSKVSGPKAELVNSNGILVEWLEGEEVTSIDEKSLLRIVSQVHQVDVSRWSLAPFQYTARIDHYWFQLVKAGLTTPLLEKLYKDLRVAPAIRSVNSCLCHFDLGPHNLIQNQDGYHLIDWEYSCLADPRIELAMLVDQVEGGLDALVAQYCEYQSIETIEDWKQGVEAWLPRVQFMALLWYLLAHHLQQNEEYLNSAKQITESLCR